MEIDKAKEIVSLLAYGIDPTTGEVLPSDSPSLLSQQSYRTLLQSTVLIGERGIFHRVST